MRSILIIEESDDWYLLLHEALTALGYNEQRISRCSCLAEIYPHKVAHPDIILLDTSLLEGAPKHIFEEVQQHFPLSAIVVIAVAEAEGLAIQCIKFGAQDYFLLTRNLNRSLFQRKICDAYERQLIRTRQRALFEESPVPMFIFDSETFDFIDVNEAALRQFGYSRDEIMRLKALVLVPPEEAEAVIKLFEGMTDTYLDAGRRLHKNKAGHGFYMHVYLRNIVVNGREAKVVLALNVHKEVKAEQAVLENSRRIEQEDKKIRAVINNTEDVIWAVDTNLDIALANDVFWATAKKYGGAPAQNIMDWDLGEERMNQWQQYYSRAFAGETFKVEIEGGDEDNPLYLEVSFNPIHDADHKITGASCFMRNITEQRKLQDTIVNDRLNLRALIDNTADLIWSVDNSFRLLSFNKAYQQAVQIRSGVEVATGDLIVDRGLGDDERAQWKHFYTRALKGEEFMVNMKWPVDVPAYAELFFSPIRDKENSVVGVTCFSRDVTERMMHLDRIKANNEALKKIAWIQSHKVRGPVASILGLIQLLDTENPEGELNRDVLGYVKEAALMLDSVIKEIDTHTKH